MEYDTRRVSFLRMAGFGLLAIGGYGVVGGRAYKFVWRGGVGRMGGVVAMRVLVGWS